MLKRSLFFILKLIAFVLTVILIYLLWLNIGTFNKAKLWVSKYIPTPIAVSNYKLFWIEDFQKYLQTVYDSKDFQIESYSKNNWDSYFQALALESLHFENPQNDTEIKLNFHKKSFASSGSEKTFTLIQEGLNNGISFSSLNQEYDQDLYSKAFYGDLGYLDSSKILPEILSELDSMAIGDIKPIASRYGWHIIQLIDKDQKGESGSQRFHLKQIFLKISGFDQWLNQEIKKVKIYKLINY